jgi:hypothetical protein
MIKIKKWLALDDLGDYRAKDLADETLEEMINKSLELQEKIDKFIKC